MQGQNAERWRELRAQAAVEQDPIKLDPIKLMELVSEINRMLSEKEERPQRQKVQQQGAAYADAGLLGSWGANGDQGPVGKW